MSVEASRSAGAGDDRPGDAAGAVAGWADVLERAIAGMRGPNIARVRVLATTASTQDAARREGRIAPRGGVMVIAGRQTAGRGRLGRAWHQGGAGGDERGGVAATFALPREEGGRLALVAGLAALDACDLAPGALGLKWPNDVVERATERKVAGVLVEVTPGATLVGIGINVGQRDADWPDDLRARAVSLGQLGLARPRIHVARGLLLALERALTLSNDALLRRWRDLDVLVGSSRSFRLRGRVVAGRVVGIDPSHAIHVVDADGREHSLPAASATLQASQP